MTDKRKSRCAGDALLAPHVTLIHHGLEREDMLVFSAKWIQPILTGKKTVTFRKWPTTRVKIGGVYDAATIGFPRKTFARVKVTGLRRIKLGDIDDGLA